MKEKKQEHNIEEAFIINIDEVNVKYDPYVNEHVEQEKYVLVMFDYAPVHNDLSFRDKWTEK